MPEQIGTIVMHFPEVSRDTHQKFTSPKLGEMDKMDQIDIFQNYMSLQWGKNKPKSMFFEIALWWWWQGSGVLLVRLYKDPGAPTNECSPFKL